MAWPQLPPVLKFIAMMFTVTGTFAAAAFCTRSSRSAGMPARSTGRVKVMSVPRAAFTWRRASTTLVVSTPASMSTSSRLVPYASISFM